MLVISTREFRTRQRHFLDMAKDGNDVLLKSRTSGIFRLVPVEEDTTVVKRDLMDELKRALMEVKDDISGKKKMRTLDELINEL